LSLDVDGGKASGSIYQPPDFRDRPLHGTVTGRRVTLEERDPSGKVLSRIEGAFPDKDPKGRFSGPLEQEVLQGTWTGADGSKKTLDLTLDHESSYDSAGVTDPAAFESAVRRFRKAVLDDERAAVAASMAYPVR